MIERSLRRIFVLVFDIFVVILTIVAIIGGPGGYKDFVEKRELADRGLAVVEISELAREKLGNHGAMEKEAINDLTIRNPFPFRGDNYGWRVVFYRFSGGLKFELGRVGAESVGEECTTQTFAIAVVHENAPIPGQMEVSVWKS